MHLVEVLAQHDEFVSAKACDGVGVTDCLPESGGGFQKELIAGVVAEPIIDLLEVVEVDEKMASAP